MRSKISKVQGFKGANLLCDSQLISIFEATLSVLYSQWYGDEGQGLSFQNCVHAEFGIPRRNYLRRRMNNPTPNQPSILAACCAVLVVGALLLAGTGCSEYNKTEERGPRLQIRACPRVFGLEQMLRSLALLEEVVSLTRGTERSVDAQYNFAKVYRCVGDYYLARYYFKMFAKIFRTIPAPKRPSSKVPCAATYSVRNLPWTSSKRNRPSKSFNSSWIVTQLAPSATPARSW